MSIQANMPIHVVGVGAVGSRILREIAEKGRAFSSEVHAWDDDIVETTNIRAQAYQAHHVKMEKVDAITLLAREWGGIEVHPHAVRVGDHVPFAGCVFLCVDSMQARKNIWENSIRNHPDVRLMIEIRIDTTGGLVHVVDPSHEDHVRQWERYWYPDTEATTAGQRCGVATALGPIASFMASLSVWQLVRFLRIRDGSEDRLDNQIRVNMVPLHVDPRQW